MARTGCEVNFGQKANLCFQKRAVLVQVVKIHIPVAMLTILSI